MRVFSGLRPAALSIAVLLLAPVAAQAFQDGTYVGRTSQGYKTHIVVRSGAVKTLNVPWLGHCRRKTLVWGPMTTFRWLDPPHDATSFTDSGRIHRNRGGERAVITAHVHGHFAGDRVIGTQSTSVRFTSRAAGANFCKASVRWSARLITR